MSAVKICGSLCLCACLFWACDSSGDDGDGDGDGGAGMVAGSGGGEGPVGGGGGPMGGGEAPPVEITPLPESTFAYVHWPGDNAGHIYLYDMESGESRLLSDLGGGVEMTRPIDISPDRKWITFSTLFRPEDEDGAFPTSIVWVMSVDGQHFRRISPSVASIHTHEACDGPMDCLDPYECVINPITQAGACLLHDYSSHFGGPRFNHDGTKIITTLSQFWTSTEGIAGGTALVTLYASGGGADLNTNLQGCQVVADPAPHPSSERLVALHSVCSGSPEGLYTYDSSSGSPTNLPMQIGVDTIYLDPIWDPNSDVIYFGATDTWDLDGDGQGETYGTAIVGYDFESEQVGPILPPLSDPLYYYSMDISPDGQKMLVCIYKSDEQLYNLFLFDPANNDNPFTPIIEDNKSCNPAW